SSRSQASQRQASAFLRLPVQPAHPTSPIQIQYILKNRATSRCLDDSGAGLRSWECNEMDFQYWYGVYAS
ncbi:hypothetical protein, partial [Streptomyces sp. NPDC056543]|uniref:hypothetical protein n=1 Tax=Streptomyces sp. NPDC056543 TaxID=3345862 RepID=UPI0036A28251